MANGKRNTMDWQDVCKQYGSLVWTVAYRLCGNSADASDCFQDCFLAAYQISDRQKIRDIKALLIRIATQRAIDLLRRNQARRRAALRYPQERTETDLSPERLAQLSELSERLRLALTRLHPEEAEAFCLRNLNDFSYRQIAGQMNCSESNVGVLIHRAREKLQRILRGIEPNEESEAAK
jgi:RNA polymerase sigma factor (sigma-70 family)